MIQDNWINWTLGKPDPSHELNSDNYLDWILIMWIKIINEEFREVGDKNACKCLKSLKKVHLDFPINHILYTKISALNSQKEARKPRPKFIWNGNLPQEAFF